MKSKLLTSHDGDFILDSSVLFGARRILRFVREYKARKAREAEKEAAKASAPPKNTGKPKAKVEEEVDPSKYTDNRKKFI